MASPTNAQVAGDDRHVTIDDKSKMSTAKFQTGSSFTKNMYPIGQGSVTTASFANMKAHMQQSSKPNNVFIENLRKNINDSIEFVTYDTDTKKTQFIVRDMMESKPKSVFGKQFN